MCVEGECKTWTLDCGLDCGLDSGLEYKLKEIPLEGPKAARIRMALQYLVWPVRLPHSAVHQTIRVAMAISLIMDTVQH